MLEKHELVPLGSKALSSLQGLACAARALGQEVCFMTLGQSQENDAFFSFFPFVVCSLRKSLKLENTYHLSPVWSMELPLLCDPSHTSLFSEWH